MQLAEHHFTAAGFTAAQAKLNALNWQNILAWLQKLGTPAALALAKKIADDVVALRANFANPAAWAELTTDIFSAIALLTANPQPTPAPAP